MRILNVGLAYPPHRVDQRTAARALGAMWERSGLAYERVARVHTATGVLHRHLTLPMESYTRARTFTETNDRFISGATDLGACAARDGLERAGLRPRDVDFLLVVSTTGVACPSIDARLFERLELRPDVRRLPIVGLGCAGGAVSLARSADLVRSEPDAVALAVCVELCSLTFQVDDASAANVVATGLFGDAAACAIVSGSRHKRPYAPTILASRSMLHAGTEDVLGFHVGEHGFRVVLDAGLPEVAVRGLANHVDALLADHGISRLDVDAWIVHPGGPKVLRAVDAALQLPPNALEHSWRCLRAVGNVSSASVLCILRDMIAEPPHHRAYGVVLGMGPGFTTEAILLRWDG